MGEKFTEGREKREGLQLNVDELIRQAKARLPDGWSLHVYIEFNFAYVYVKHANRTVWNVDMWERLSIPEQIEIAVNSLGMCRCSVHELPEHNEHCPLAEKRGA